jgi:hypothetical protein
MIILHKEAEEFLAKIYCDLGKNIVSIGFASYFFKDLPLLFRVSFGILGLGLLAMSVINIQALAKRGEK